MSLDDVIHLGRRIADAPGLDVVAVPLVAAGDNVHVVLAPEAPAVFAQFGAPAVPVADTGATPIPPAPPAPMLPCPR